MVCSTGAPKIINCEYGGFIGISKNIKQHLEEKNKMDELKQLLKTYKVPNIYGSMKEEALIARKTYKKLVKFSNIIKDNFENAYFKDKEGVCVFLEYENPKEIFKEQKEILINGGFEIIDEINIEPFEKDHIMFVGIWKGY